MRSMIVLGSLLGAAAIHTAFVACGQMSAEAGGPIGAIMAAMSDGGVAHAAQDGGAPTCSCPVPPASPETTFALRVDRGAGAQELVEEWSNATVGIGLTGKPGKPARVVIQSGVGGYLEDGNSVTLKCNVYVTTGGIPSPQDGPEKGQTNIGNCTTGTASTSEITYLHERDVQIIKLTDTEMELRIPVVSVATKGVENASPPIAPQVFRFTDVVIRHTDPSAHYLTPPRAYRPRS
jgi:hypothetical protein